jgi:hypothetical protein
MQQWCSIRWHEATTFDFVAQGNGDAHAPTSMAAGVGGVARQSSIVPVRPRGRVELGQRPDEVCRREIGEASPDGSRTFQDALLARHAPPGPSART